MKKIIATVLAMVMALALCTTAFAAGQKYDLYDAETGNKVSAGVYLGYSKADTSSATKKLAFYYFAATENAAYDASTSAKYVKTTNTADASLVVKYEGKDTVAMYVAEVSEVEYTSTATAYTDIGSKCGQYKLAAGETTSDKFYTATNADDQKVHLLKKDDSSSVKVLVDGAVVKVTDKGVLANWTVEHTWSIDVEKGMAKCTNCGATGKVYKTYVEVPSGADATQVAGVWVVADKTASTDTKTDSNKSPKTFDAGIAMYVGMALTSVAGSAVVIGKKKEF